MKGSQVAGTECGLNWVGFTVDKEPASMMIVLPDQGTAKEWSSQRLTQLAEDTPCLQGKIKDQRQRDGGNTVFSKKFPGGHLKITWSSSAKKLRSTPAANILADEVDGFDGDVKGEGDPIALLRRRFTNYPRGKLCGVSTPTLRHLSRIEREFRRGDQRYFFVPCPHCGHFQRLVFANIRWTKGQPWTAHAICIGCEQQIAESNKTELLARGMWVATATAPELAENGFAADRIAGLAHIFRAMDEAVVASFHLPSFYSPLGWYSWPQMATDWEGAQGNPSLLKVFVNTVLGETWADRGEVPDPERLFGRHEEFPIGIVPMRGLFITGSCDVQADRLEVSFCAWGRNRERWGIWYEVIKGDPSTDGPWMQLEKLLQHDWAHESGASLQVLGLGIDTGYRPQKVYEFCARHPQPMYDPARGMRIVIPRTCIPVKGGHSWDKVIENVSTTDAAKKRSGLRIVTFGTPMLKDELHYLLRLPKPETGDVFPIGYCHYAYREMAFYQGLCSETRVTRNGKAEWVLDPRFRNEPLDLEVYHRGVATLCGLESPKEAKWAALEANIKAQVAAKAVGRPSPVIQQQSRQIIARSRFMQG